MKHPIEKIRGRKILVIGDLMLDLYLSGQAKRISPEAPVPIVVAEREDKIPGGAANVMTNLCALGCMVTGAGFVGKDVEGDFLLNTLNLMRVNTEAVVQCSLPTIHKTRIVANGQHVVRFDCDSDFEKLKEDQSELLSYVSSLAETRHFDAVVVSDYCKGTITSDTMSLLKSSFSCPIICDTKPLHKDDFSNVWCITPNLDEAKQMSGLASSNVGALTIAKKLKEDMQLHSIIITMADHGILCIDDTGSDFSYPAYVEIDERDTKHRFDVTGAGDTVISVFSACIAAGIEIRQAVLAANVAAGIVVRKTGTASCSFEELVAEPEKEQLHYYRYTSQI